MTHYSGQGGGWDGAGGDEAPPVGGKRAKLRGYLKAANELRQTYQAQYANSGGGQRGLDDFQEGIPGGYPDASVVTSGAEQMILFPSYARKHVKKKDERPPRPTLEDQKDENQGDFMKQQWEEYKEDNAVVDVDVRGWVFSPHKGQMTRRQRVFISLARQLAGLPAPAQPSPINSAGNSRDASPHTAHRQRVQERSQRHEEEEAARQAEELVRRGESEAAAASKGEYTEGTSHQPPPTQRQPSSIPSINPLERRAAWNQPADMTHEELASANAHLMARLAPFMSNPLADTPISAFFYNDTVSRQRTIYTSSYGHFALRASLDFVPTHVRILASENLSATEEVIVTPSKGISLISDVDDTIKHSAISSGAREIFRNAFIRDLADLNIDGVTDWYSSLYKKGVQFHYVSNSPWQLYPVLHKYFEMSGLPPGSFHLKQYSGMLQGIFEPVAERKKGTLDRIAGDFPERKFVLVGDSGEADLEVYLDFVAENPGRVLAIFIRDVTTPHGGGFFDSSTSGFSGQRSATTGRQGSINGAQAQSRVQALDDEEDPELKAAIAASLKTLEEEEMRNRPSLPPRRPTDPAPETEDLIDLSDDPPTHPPMAQRSMSSFAVPPTASNGVVKKQPPPVVKKKPLTLQSKPSGSSPVASSSSNEDGPAKKVPPPPPVRRSTAASTSFSQTSTPSTNSANKPPPPLARKPQLDRQNSDTPSIAPSFASTYSQPGYRESARQKLASAYNALPAAPWNSSYVHTELNRNSSYSNSNDTTPRRTGTNLSSYGPSAAARGVTNAWANYNDPGRLSGPEQSVAARPYSSVSGGGDPGRGNANVNQALNKRLELWAQRWARAQEYCRERGVVLRSWRVGSDVRGECERIVEREGKRLEAER